MIRQSYEVSVSICMATYNGAYFLPKQINSILSQMEACDELIIVDDASSDDTLEYLVSLNDPRIKIFQNLRNLGHVQSFSRALGLASGQYVFMADQDDVWVENRLRDMKISLSRGVALVSGNSLFIDRDGCPIEPIHPKLLQSDSSRYGLNIARIFLGKAYYFGCAMGMSKDFVSLVTPIPSYVESHDLWIAMAANLIGSNHHLEKNTLLRRIHGSNSSVVKRSLFFKIRSRLIFGLSLISIVFRVLRLKFSRLFDFSEKLFRS